MKEQLQKLRKAKGLTQEDIARIIDVKLSTYQKYERDVISPPYETLIRIADFYHVTTDYLLGRDTETPEPLDQLSTAFDMSALEREIVDGYLNLPKSLRGDVMDFLQKAVEKVQHEQSVKEQPKNDRKTTETDLDQSDNRVPVAKTIEDTNKWLLDIQKSKV